MNDVKALRRKLEKLGFTCIRTTAGHFKLFKDGQFIRILPGNPTSNRALLNTKVQLRKAGIEI